MQQLAQWQYCEENQTILYIGSELPKWDEFGQWCDTFCQKQFSLISLEHGADRQQMHFRFAEYDYLLCYEALCEALWIEAFSQQASAALTVLSKRLDSDTHDDTNHL
jgi:hypothetical protein